ncbi:MAG: cation transporter [Verrucomicrobia bacterium]|nr:MAG: cation transporter [Verrucomicrobiota bacterium]
MSQRLQRTLRATLVGLGANLILGLAKLAAGIYGHSDALVADAVESFADLIGSIIVWQGLAVASRPPDDDHPYGHGKAESLAGAAISTLLLLAAAGIGFHAVREFLGTHIVPSPYTLVVLLGVIAIKETLFRWVLRESEATQSTAVRTDAWHHRADAITSLAAAVGISLALVGGERWAGADDIAAIVAAGIIAWNGWRLLRPALEELMDTQPSAEVVERIRDIAAAVPAVDQIQKCLVRRMGYQLLVDMHVHVDPGMTVEQSHAIAHAVKDSIRDEMPSVIDVLIHIEPSRRTGPGS